MGYATLGAANFLYIFLKAWQQRNVAHLHYGWALITNFFLVCVEVAVMGSIALAATGVGPLALPYVIVTMTIGGGTGCLMSMYIHSTYIRKKDA